MVEITNEEHIWSNDFLELKKIKYEENNQLIERIIVNKKDVVAAISITNEEKIILVRQFRAAVNENVWELPAGHIEKVENPEDAIWRELLEETGYSARDFVKLFSGYSSPGFTNEKVHIYKANGLTKIGTQHLDEDEGKLEVSEFSVEEVQEMLDNGVPMSLYTILGLQYYLSSLDIKCLNS